MVWDEDGVWCFGDYGNMSEKKYHGFQDYVETGTFTPAFIKDFEYWSKKIFYHWKLFVDFDWFYTQCWEALLSKIDEFDPAIATIQTFCISRINNEAWRTYMKWKSKKVEIDCDSEVMVNTLESGENHDVFESLYSFSLYAKSMGIDVNLRQLYDEYTGKKETPAIIAYACWKNTNM